MNGGSFSIQIYYTKIRNIKQQTAVLAICCFHSFSMLSGVLIRQKLGNIFDIILKKTCIFRFIYVDWSGGLLDSRGKSETVETLHERSD